MFSAQKTRMSENRRPLNNWLPFWFPEPVQAKERAHPWAHLRALTTAQAAETPERPHPNRRFLFCRFGRDVF